ncbi:uncharacterized protein [Pocillopora verrucosa]|uniref:uncharacterized protein n=1 Tax=Pocillopora verrucosa TaxID=203993 RepID=UPI00334241E5
MTSTQRSPSHFYYFLIGFVLLAVGAQVVKSADDVPDSTTMDLIERINRDTDPSAEQVAIMENDIRMPPSESDASSNEFSNAIRQKFLLWPGGVVPYVLADSIKNRSKHIEVLFEAMKIWERATCIKFVKRTTESRYAIIFYGSSGCNSNIGAMFFRPSMLSLGANCQIVSIATHELGHLLGFGHEQNRPDRDHYVDILWQNIAPADYRIFRRQSYYSFSSYGVPYDYHSIMHYGRYHFSKNGQPTIRARDPTVKWFGSRSLSKLDIQQMNLMYSCPDIPVFPEQFSIRDTSSAHLNCIALDQPGDREWRTKYLCYKPALKRLTITWSRNGEITNQDCVNTRMPHVRSSRLWEKSYLCLPRNSLLKLSWSTDGPLKGKGCLEVRRKGINGEGYFLCGTSKYKKIDGDWSRWSRWRSCSHKCGGGHSIRTRSCDSPSPKYGGAQCQGSYYESKLCKTQRCPEFPSWPADFKFLFISFSPRRHKCIPIYERSQYRSWARARLCWPSNKRFIDIRWSDQGKITGMSCTKITQENGRIQRNGWDDNFLCARNVPYTFSWSTNGPIKGLRCLRWQNNYVYRRRVWQNNYLCANEYPIPTRAPTTGCYSYWHSFTVKGVPHCYFPVLNKRVKWTEAQELCREVQSNLVSIHSIEEQSFIRRLSGRSSFWIGLEFEREWQWSDRSRLSYLNWSPGEPNNGGRGRPEKCAMFSGRGKNWNDYPCDSKFAYICKMKAALN